jgi:hypothetical protein
MNNTEKFLLLCYRSNQEGDCPFNPLVSFENSQEAEAAMKKEYDEWLVGSDESNENCDDDEIVFVENSFYTDSEARINFSDGTFVHLAVAVHR